MLDFYKKICIVLNKLLNTLNYNQIQSLAVGFPPTTNVSPINYIVIYYYRLKTSTLPN